MACHVLLTRIVGVETQHTAARPLTTHFIKRQPRLTKPLELRKRPQPKRRHVQRKMVSVKARMRRDASVARFRPIQVLGGLPRPKTDVGRMGYAGAMELEPACAAVSVQGARGAEQRIDMSLELLDVLALDTGKYHALVVVDPTDKRSVKGFLHLAAAFPSSSPVLEQEWWAQIVQGLVEAMNRFTDIRTDLRGKYTYDSRELFKIPWLNTRHHYGGFKLSDSEATNLGQYLLLGGFLFAGGNPQGSAMYTMPDTSLRGMMKDALGSQGVEFAKDWNFQKLPNSHAMYHCYFDFDGPPIGQDYDHRWPVIPYLEGIELGDRLAVVLSHKGYDRFWLHKGTAARLDNTRQLQFGVNTIVFALTQKGSITHRVLDSVRY